MAVGRLHPIELTETLEHLNLPSFIADRSGRITWMNAAARRAFGDLIGKPFNAAVAPEDQMLVHRALERKLQGAPVTDYVVDVFTADSRRRQAEISSVPIRGGDACHAVFGVALPGPPRAVAAGVDLTRRQMQVLQLLGEGASTEDIASMLHISKETVRNHVRRILGTLGAHSRLEAVAIAHRLGMLNVSHEPE
jgi:PAS domain S-box-containing protein